MTDRQQAYRARCGRNRRARTGLAGLLATAMLAVSLFASTAPAAATQHVDMHDPNCPVWRMSDRPYTGFGVIGIDANPVCVNWAHGHVLDLPLIGGLYQPTFTLTRTLMFVNLDLQRYYGGAWHDYAGEETRLENCSRITSAPFLPFNTSASGRKIRVEGVGICDYESSTANVHAQTSLCPPAGLWRGLLTVDADEEIDTNIPGGIGDVLPHDVKLLSVASGTFDQTRHC